MSNLLIKPGDELAIEKICQNSGVHYFYGEFRLLIENVIEELYFSNRALVSRLKLQHIDRAMFKFKQAKRNTCIRNTRQYFKACIKSAIFETALEGLDFFELSED
jgi:hypothetical protein